jgi:hypothetical protein
MTSEMELVVVAGARLSPPGEESGQGRRDAQQEEGRPSDVTYC